MPPFQHPTYFLPDWLFSSSPFNDTLWIVYGISDPALPSDLAFRQAWLRANGLLTLMLDLDLKTGNFAFENTNENKTPQFDLSVKSKFTRLLDCNARKNVTLGSFILLDSATTLYGEKIIKLAFNSDSKSFQTDEPTYTEVNLILFHNEYGENENFLNNGLLELKIWSDESSLAFKSYSQEKNTQLQSFYNDSLLCFKPDYYRYFSPVTDSTEYASVATDLYSGLWNAYITNIAYQLLNHSAENNTTVNFVKDNFITQPNKTIKSFNSNELSSQYNIFRTSFGLQKIAVSENELKIKLHFNQQFLSHEK